MSFVDLHCHILPGIDDGAPTLEHTVAYARRLAAAGVTDVACTSHVKRDEFPRVEIARLAELREQAQQAIDDEGIAVRLHPGGELSHYEVPSLGPDELALIAQGPADARWLLLETPFEGVEADFTEAAEHLWDLGYDLLLAHPERAAALPGADRRLVELIDRGALVQVNATSLLGRHGAAARAGAERLLGAGMVWCLASDGHPGTRDDTLDRGYEALLARGTHERVAALLTQDNPRALLLDGAPRLQLAA